MLAANRYVTWNGTFEPYHVSSTRVNAVTASKPGTKLLPFPWRLVTIRRQHRVKSVRLLILPTP